MVNPSYHNLGDHTESVDVDYDPAQTNYGELLKLFWKNHDPTSICSRQYRSVIYYHDEEQKKLAEDTLKLEQKKKNRPITTAIVPAKEFYKAEMYHQKYMLQKYPHVINALDIDPGDELIQSHVAARINGYLGRFGSLKAFNAECEKWGITEKMADYIRKQIVS